MEEKKSKTAVTNTDSAADDNGKPKSVQKSNSEKTAAAIVKPKKSGPKKKHTSKNKYETKEISSSPVTKEVSEPEKTPEIIELHAEIQGGTEKQSVKSVEPDLKQEQTVKTVEISVGTSPEIENNDQKDNTSDISADPKESPLTVNDRTNES
ncbi:MAG: hypothetical protein EOM64_08690, partial [Erysipelotrichia bacterium]|nr:hypothetical protein [Erysipelotrichia bacterium]